MCARVHTCVCACVCLCVRVCGRVCLSHVPCKTTNLALCLRVPACRPPPFLTLLSSRGSGGFPDPANLLPAPASLPPPEELARARASLPSSQLLLFDLLGDAAAGAGAATELHVRLAFEALHKEAQGPQQLKLEEVRVVGLGMWRLRCFVFASPPHRAVCRVRPPQLC